MKKKEPENQDPGVIVKVVSSNIGTNIAAQHSHTCLN